jgi:hypothetical protein
VENCEDRLYPADERKPLDLEDRLLQGAIDLHAHAYPEFSLKMRGRVTEIEWARLARSAGMRAIVMKSQVFPTVERALMTRQVVAGLEIFGGITLNHTIGGLNPMAVEVAAELGGKVVWMPTWGSKNDLSHSRFYLTRMSQYIRSAAAAVPGPEEGIEIVAGGKLKPVVAEIIQIARDHGMAISSGHISVAESLVLVEACVQAGVPFCLAHPFSRSVGASIEQQKEIAQRGGFIEHCFITAMPMHQRLELKMIVEAIAAVGAEQTVLTTDAIQTWNPPPPELLRMYVASLLHLGIDESAIRRMIQINPAKILGLEAAREA